MTEGRFKASSPEAAVALNTASALLVLLEDSKHSVMVEDFTVKLYSKLKSCFQHTHSSLHLNREKMWGLYHELRTSDSFKEEWSRFLHECGKQPCASFVQFVTNTLFKQLIEEEFPLNSTTNSNGHSGLMTFEEKNALRYVAGYVCRTLRKRLESSTIPDKDDMIYALMELSGDEMNDQDTEAWTDLIDRGGLWHISDDTYMLFLIIEECIREHVTIATASTVQGGKTLTDTLLKNEDVLFQWCILGVETNDVDLSLLRKIISLYVTIRGFAFATSCLELYKQAQKKSLQKKRALRKSV